MTGASYDGTTANAAAVEQPPHLATIIPVSAISRWWGYAYQQGARSHLLRRVRRHRPAVATRRPTSCSPTASCRRPTRRLGARAADRDALEPVRPGRAELSTATTRSPTTTPSGRSATTCGWPTGSTCRCSSRTACSTSTSRPGRAPRGSRRSTTEKAMVLGQWPHAIPPWVRGVGRLPRALVRALAVRRSATASRTSPPVVVESTDGEFRSREHWAGTGTPRHARRGRGRRLLRRRRADRDRDAARRVRRPLRAGEAPGLGGVQSWAGRSCTCASRRPALDPLRRRAARRAPSGDVICARLHERPLPQRARDRARTSCRASRRRDARVDRQGPRRPAEGEVELILASSSTTWVLPTSAAPPTRSTSPPSTLEIPTDGPEPALRARGAAGRRPRAAGAAAAAPSRAARRPRSSSRAGPAQKLTVRSTAAGCKPASAAAGSRCACRAAAR